MCHFCAKRLINCIIFIIYLIFASDQCTLLESNHLLRSSFFLYIEFKKNMTAKTFITLIDLSLILRFHCY